MPMQTKWDLLPIPQRESDHEIKQEEIEQLRKLEQAATLAATVAEGFRRKLELRKRLEPPVAMLAYFFYQ
jgi:hypothetical protein